MDTDGPSGFRNAPVTKLLVPIVGGVSALAAMSSLRPHMALQLSHITINGQFWRLFTSHWAFGSIGSSVVGTWLIYRMKIIERRFGSSKYAAMVFISFVASTLLQTGALFTGSRLGLKSIASGPFSIIFTILYQYQTIIPASYQVKTLGINLSDKTYVYFAATQLLLTNSTSSMVPCICGLIVGAIYGNTNLSHWRFPKWVRAFSSKHLLPIIATQTSKKNTTPALAPNVDTGATAASSSSPSGASRQRHTVPPAPPAPPISESDIDTMFSMFPNYSRENIKNALISSKSDLNRAAEILLTQELSADSSSSSNHT